MINTEMFFSVINLHKSKTKSFVMYSVPYLFANF